MAKPFFFSFLSTFFVAIIRERQEVDFAGSHDLCCKSFHLNFGMMQYWQCLKVEHKEKQK